MNIATISELFGESVWTVVVVVAAVVGTYFFLRNNKMKKAQIDQIVEEVKKKLQ